MSWFTRITSIVPKSYVISFNTSQPVVLISGAFGTYKGVEYYLSHPKNSVESVGTGTLIGTGVGMVAMKATDIVARNVYTMSAYTAFIGGVYLYKNYKSNNL